MRRMLLALPLLIAGCAIGPPLEQRLSPFIGQTEDALVAALGVPARTYQTDDRKFLQYEDRRAQILAADPYWYRPLGRFPPILSPAPSFIVRSCDITFALRHGRVESFTWRGDGCR